VDNSYSNPYSSSQYGSAHGQSTASKPHSQLGIASLALSVFAGFFLFVAVMIAGIMETTRKGGMDETSNAAAILGLAILGLLGLEAIAGVLGLVGLFQTDRKRIFAVIGLFLSAMAFLGIVGLIILGSMT
jgi:hypothetical protein